MKGNWIATGLLLVVAVMAGAAALDVAVIVSRPLWPWLAWMGP